MTSSKKFFAFVAYLLLVPGWLLALLLQRQEPFVRFHARQSFALNAAALLLFVVWFAAAWLLMAIPIIGPIAAWFLFAIVIAGLIFLVILWVSGMIQALRSDTKPLFLIGNWLDKVPF